MYAVCTLRTVEHYMSMRRPIIYSVVTILSLFFCLGVFSPPAMAFAGPGKALDVPGCGNLDNAFGPFDYRDTTLAKQRYLVEMAHFTPSVEALTSGNTSHLPGHDLDYTLRAFPNHHRALNSVARYQLKFPGTHPPRMNYTADCYFLRAIAFAPDDAIVLMLRGNYRITTNNYKLALKDYQDALKIAPDGAEIHYNLGLLYVKLKDYENARIHAQRAYQLGYPLPGLRDQLKRLGEWKDEGRN